MRCLSLDQVEASAALQLGFEDFFPSSDARLALLEWLTDIVTDDDSGSGSGSGTASGGTGVVAGAGNGSPVRASAAALCDPQLLATLTLALSAEQWIAQLCVPSLSPRGRYCGCV